MYSPFERRWFPVKNLTSTEATIENFQIFYMKDMDTGFLMIDDLEFTTTDKEDHTITFDLPDLNQTFKKCENTIFAIKNGTYHSLVKIEILPTKLNITGFPLTTETTYKLSGQFFFRLGNGF